MFAEIDNLRIIEGRRIIENVINLRPNSSAFSQENCVGIGLLGKKASTMDVLDISRFLNK